MSHLVLRAEHHGVPRITLAHLAQVHPLVSPCQLVRLVNLDVAPRAQLCVVVEAEHRRRGVVAERTIHHGPTSNPTRTAPKTARRRAEHASSGLYSKTTARDYPKVSRQMRPSSPRRLPTRRPSTALTPPPTFLDARSTRVSTRAPQKRVASRSERLVPRPQLYRNFLLPKTLGYIFLSQIDRPEGHFIQFASDFLGVGFSSRPVIGPLRLLLKYRFGTFFGTSTGKQ